MKKTSHIDLLVQNSELNNSMLGKLFPAHLAVTPDPSKYDDCPVMIEKDARIAELQRNKANLQAAIGDLSEENDALRHKLAEQQAILRSW